MGCRSSDVRFVQLGRYRRSRLAASPMSSIGK
jgi:hypothetical protein